MKKFAVILLMFLSAGCFAQENLFQKVKEDLKKKYPDLVLENKLIIINVWSFTDPESRDANIQLDKTVNVYQNAKLRGGLKGVVGVTVCKDSDEKMQEISLAKDNVVKPVSLKYNKEIKKSEFSNIIFDSEGKEVIRNVPSGSMFKTVQLLITR